MHRARRLSGERGAAIVEMILVLPLLLFVTFAIVELSRAWFTLQLATAAIRDGARAAAVASTNVSTTGTTRIESILSAGGITTSSQGAKLLSDAVTLQTIPGCTSTPPPPCDSEVVATVTVEFSTFFPLLPSRLQNLPLSQTARMRWEGG